MKSNISFNNLSEMDKNLYLKNLLDTKLLYNAVEYYKKSDKFTCDADLLFFDDKFKPLLVEFCKKNGINGIVKFIKNGEEVYEPIINFTLYNNLECLSNYLLVNGAKH